MESKERRKFKRVASQFNVRITNETADSNADFSVNVARTINISASGMLFTINRFLDVQKIVRLIFVKPNSFDIFEGLARVVRTVKNNDMTYQVAVAFIGLSMSEMNDLDLQIMMPA